ncbi:hypothetical protein GE061_020153 [Apolygus lucorum]|uniref:MAU2 chromatid cohesion factor homolog n=1 Tax=Apolygus lucorum TaxID=248454 RepID=A0A8S9WKA8_APOLU|nr:hypothetical protein GE061_020153 [Apolygus lucorum]
MASSQDAWYLSLLGLAEYFRTCSPPDIKKCIQCLHGVFTFKPPSRVEARTHLQLGNVLLTHTKNIDLARNYLEQAWMLSQNINPFDDVKFEAASVLASVLLFQLAQIHASERDYELACSLLSVGVDYAHISSAHYTRVLFLLSRCMLMLIDKKFSDVLPLLNQAGHLLETWQGNQYQKEYLKVFFLVLQVCHFLMAGQVKSVKPCLKQLQQNIQTIMLPSWPSDEVVSGPNVGDMFIWMPKEHLYVLVYLVTVMHSMQAGYMDKAQKYTDKALLQIEKLKIADDSGILCALQLMLIEHMVMCRLVMGHKCIALTQMANACALCTANPVLMKTHRPQLHVLLGLYAMSMNCMPAAEKQFNAAILFSQERDLWTFANLNLGIVYLRGKRESDFNALLDRINPENLPSHSHSLRAAAYYVLGLQSFFQARHNEAKRFLRETLKMANAEDSNRLTSCSLVLLGHIFLSLGNSRESMNMVTPAMQLASKIPDVHVQLWASAILRDLYRICQNITLSIGLKEIFLRYLHLLHRHNNCYSAICDHSAYL